MGLFTKKTKTSFKRNKAGEVIDVERSENKPLFGKRKSRTPTFDALEKEYYRQHPEETTSYKAKTTGKKLLDAFDNWADNYNKGQRKSRKKTSRGNTRYVIRGGKAYPIARSTSKKKKNYDTPRFEPFTMDDFYNPFNSGKKKKGKKQDFDIFDNSGLW